MNLKLYIIQCFRLKGNYYLVTSKKQPFGMGRKGITSLPK